MAKVNKEKSELINLELSLEEVNIVLECLDSTVKVGGLQAASKCLPLAVKISGQANPDQPSAE